MVCIIQKQTQISSKESSKLIQYTNISIGPSGSNERSNSVSGATPFHSTCTDPIGNEPITWNWNPHAASKYNYENQFGQKRKRNNTRLCDDGMENQSNGKSLSMWSNDENNTDVKNSNFWSKILYNNKETTNSFPSTSNTAVIFNSIFSNSKDHKQQNADGNDVDAINRNFNQNDAVVPSSSSTASNSNSSKSKNALPKHKLNKNHANQSDDGAIGDRSRMSLLNNDLSAANSTFLRALNDLQLDYNDINSINQREHQSTSKER